MRPAHAARSILLALLGLPAAAVAQDATDIFVADLRIADGTVQVSAPTNVTARPGYDNQPWFLPDGSGFLYVAQVDGQMDVFRHDIASGRSEQVTRTPWNEFSPTLPGDGSRMLVVRWAADMSTGALWWYTPDGSPIEEASGSVPRVGYYTFADAHTLALFINDDTQSFHLSDTRSGSSERIGEGMGGSAPRTIPGAGRAVSFLRKGDDDAFWLSRLDIDSRTVTPLVRMLDGVANYTWIADGHALAASGGTLHEWRSGSDGWRPVVTFDDPALQAVTRIAVSPKRDRIALVSSVPAD